MTGDNFVEAKDKADKEVMERFVEFLHENTGVFGNESWEAVTVHLGGHSCAYIAGYKDMNRNRSPVMRHLEENENLRLRSVGVVSRNRDGSVEKEPKAIIEVVEDGN